MPMCSLAALLCRTSTLSSHATTTSYSFARSMGPQHSSMVCPESQQATYPSLISIAGQQVAETETALQHGDRIIFASQHFFRLNIPKTAKRCVLSMVLFHALTERFNLEPRNPKPASTMSRTIDMRRMSWSAFRPPSMIS